MKSLIIFTLSFLLAFPPQVFALSQDQHSRMKEFLEISEITKREVPLRELYGKFESALTEEVRAPFREYVTLNPNAVLPKFSISKVLGENGEQDIQLSFGTKGKGSGSVQLIGRGKIAAQAGEVKITVADLENPLAVIAKMEQAFPAAQFAKPQIKVKNFGLLSAKQVNSLSHDEKRLYFQSLQQLLAAMEKVETSALAAKAQKTSSSEYFFSTLLPMAWAASQHNNEAAKNIKVNDNNYSCIYAGHVTNYGYKVEGVTVQPKDRVKGHYSCGGDSSSFKAENFRCKSNPAQIQCNSAVYGDDPVVCIQEKSLNATALCNERATQYDAFPRGEIKDAKAFDALKAKVVKNLGSQEAACAEIKSKPALRLEDQSATCDNLISRINEIKAVTCESLAANKRDKFKDLKCSVQGGTSSPGAGGTPSGNPGSSGSTGADGSPGGTAPGTSGSTTGTGSVATPPATATTNPGPTAGGKCDPALYSKEPDFVKAVTADCGRTQGRVVECVDAAAPADKWVQCQCGSNPIGKTPAPNGRTYFCEKSPTAAGSGAPSKASSVFSKLDGRLIAGVVLGFVVMLLKTNSVRKSTKAIAPVPTAPYAPSTTEKPNYRGAK